MPDRRKPSAWLRFDVHCGWFLEAKTWVRGPWWLISQLADWAADNDITVKPDPWAPIDEK